MRAALLQMDVLLGDAAANRARALALIEAGLARGAGLFVLPELWTTGYALEAIGRLAEPEGGPTLRWLQGLAAARGIEILAGSLAVRCGGGICNRAYAIGRDGALRGHYDKIHLIGLMGEDRHLSPGGEPGLVPLGGGPAGVLICYDLRFPELARALALAGARILFVPAQWPAERGAHWRALAIARAIENQCFVLAVNRVGEDRENRFFGHSLAVDPWGEVLAEGGGTDEEVLVVDLDLAQVTAVRRRLPLFADRRPECYGPAAGGGPPGRR